MGAYYLAEIAVELIQAQIKANIVQALADVRAARGDAIVTTEPPHEYFVYETPHVYRPPAIFTIIQGMDFRNDIAHNKINALNDIVVASVVEDRVERLVEIKSWRYQAALTQCLHLVSLTNSGGGVRLFSRVKSCRFSGIINIKPGNQSSETVFRKEVSLSLAVEHIENLE